MKKNIISSTNALMRQLVGLTGHAESFAPKTVKVKPFNANRYMNAYAALQVDAAVAKAESFKIKSFILERKALGEADSTIVAKVKNGATDLWRKVKELIGKLIILAEEFFRGLFDKTKKASKLADALMSNMKKLSSINKKDDKFTVNESVTVRLPKNSITAVINARAKNRINSINRYINYDKRNRIGEENTKIERDAVDFWMSFLKKETKDKVYKEVFKLIKEQANEVKKDGTFKNVTSLSVGKDTYSTGTGLLAYVESIEKGNLELKRLKEEISKESKKSEYDEYTVNAAKEVRVVVMTAKKFHSDLVKSVKNVENMNKSIKEIKLVLNKVKNAPTKVTGNTDPKVLQIIRTYCTRMSTSLNLVRSIKLTELNRLIMDASDCNSVVTQVLSLVDYKDGKSGSDDDFIGSSRYAK